MTTVQVIYSYALLPLLALIHVASNFWVNRRQRAHLEVLQNSVESFRKYEDDLRKQLADQKALIETVKEVVPLLKTVYEHVDQGKDKLLQIANEQLSKAQEAISNTEQKQMSQIDMLRLDPGLANILTDIVSETTKTKEQIATVVSQLDVVVQTHEYSLATSKEMMVRNSVHQGLPLVLVNEKQDKDLYIMARKLQFQRIKFVCEAKVYSLLSTKGYYSSTPQNKIDVLNSIAEECATLDPSLVQEYTYNFFASSVHQIADELVKLQMIVKQ